MNNPLARARANEISPLDRSFSQVTGMVRKLKHRLKHLEARMNHGLSKASVQYLSGSAGLTSVPLSTVISNDSILLDAPILDEICLPPYRGPRHDDFTPLMKIAKHLDAKVILELGTAHGNTVANLCLQCPSAKIITVNAASTSQSGKLTTFELTPQEIGIVYRNHGFGERVTQILANTLTLDLSEHLRVASVDLAIVDACHDTEYVINDFHKVRDYVKRGGYVLLHDTHPSMTDHLIGSYRACMKLRKQGFDIRHIEGTWWALWEPASI